MASALDVARCFIKLAAAEEEPEQLSPMRVQKLLYYAQGWSLAVRGKELFPEEIEAWVHGPVVKKIYKAFEKYGSGSIPSEEEPPPANMTKEEAEFIGRVWNTYKDYSTAKLRAMTHEERPWVEARKGAAPADRCDEALSHKTMKEYFSALTK